MENVLREAMKMAECGHVVEVGRAPEHRAFRVVHIGAAAFHAILVSDWLLMKDPAEAVRLLGHAIRDIHRQVGEELAGNPIGSEGTVLTEEILRGALDWPRRDRLAEAAASESVGGDAEGLAAG